MPRHQPASSEELARRIAAFVAQARSPVLLEPGEEPIALTEGAYAIEIRRGGVWIEAWEGGRSLVRRALEIKDAPAGTLELVVERFGKRRGRLTIADRERRRGAAASLRAGRQVFLERMRGMVRRQFPGWALEELTTGADLEHSLSPACPRGVVRRGTSAWAVIGAPATAAGGALSFGILWLDYLRSRRGRQIAGLAAFVPEAQCEIAARRMQFLDAGAAGWRLYAYTGEGEALVNPGELGNLRTRLEPPGGGPVIGIEWAESRLAEIDGVEIIDLPGGGRSYRVRGLEFGRVSEGRLWAGIDAKRRIGAAKAGELIALARELSRIRQPSPADPSHPYYRRRPEAWLESQIRRRVDELDPSLHPRPVYGQVPALEARDRDVLDLLAVDRAGRLAVIEVKAAADIHLPLQALDYWMRVRRHALRGEFQERGYFAGLPVRNAAPRLLLAAPALEFHPAVGTILRYVSAEVPVECVGLAADWRRRIRVVWRAVRRRNRGA